MTSRSAFDSLRRRQISSAIAGADVLVAIEGVLRRRVVLGRGGARLGHVVQERREADEPRRAAGAARGELGRVDGGERVLPDVVRVEAVLVQADALEQLGDDRGEQAGRAHQLQAHRGLARQQDLDQLVAHALGRHLAEDVDRLGDGRSVAGSMANSSCAAKRTARMARRPSSEKRSSGSPTARMSCAARSRWPPKGSASRSVERVVGDRVHREVAPLEILVERAHEDHLVGAPSVAVGALAAEGGDLDVLPRPVALGEHGDGAVLLAGRDGALAPEHARDLGRLGRGGDVEVLGGAAAQEIAHRAADQPRFEAGIAQLAAHLDDVGRDG